MKRFLLGASALVAIGTANHASAADLAARPYTKAPMVTPAYDWSGFYAGANGGWGSSRNCWTNTSVLGVPTVPPASEGCHDATGGTAGGQFGYRWQSGGWVFGLEAQGNWADFSGSNLSTFSGLTDQTRIDVFGLFTGQLGYAVNNVLFYVKGGGAVTGNRYKGFAAGGIFTDTSTDVRGGGTAGAGVEFGFAPGWSAGIEYDHLFMGTNNRAFGGITPPPFNTRNDNIRQDADIAIVRINYRFGGPVIY